MSEVFGPDYPRELGAAVAKFRAKARGGLSDLSREERRAYGAAVEKAILAKQKAEFMRASVEPGHRCPCASGTWHSDGAAIHEAVRRQQLAALLACPSQIRRERSKKEWERLYKAAMAEKRARESKVAEAARPINHARPANGLIRILPLMMTRRNRLACVSGPPTDCRIPCGTAIVSEWRLALPMAEIAHAMKSYNWLLTIPF